MPAIVIFTGSAGPGIGTAAAAAALHAAAPGRRALLLSLGPAHGQHALPGAPAGPMPAEVAPQLDALAIDGLADMAAIWERERSRLPAGLAQVAGDELPLPLGAELLLGLLRLRELSPHYATVVLDAGPHDTLLRTLAAPDALRWAVRLLFGLDRGAGRNPASLGRALLPTSFIPADTYAGVQDARVRAEQLRDQLLAPGAAAVHYVLRPDPAALAEARVAIPALQLHGLPVRAIAAGPLLPEAPGHPALTALAAQQTRVLAEAAAAWPSRPLHGFELHADADAPAALATIGARLAGTALPPSTPPAGPITTTWQNAPALAIELPGLPKGALQLTLSGDELIVRVGPYRRHILLPEALRGVTDIRATREGEHLVVRRR